MTVKTDKIYKTMVTWKDQQITDNPIEERKIGG